MKTREEIITSMCYTWRHDYGIPFEPWTDVFSCDAEWIPKRPNAGIGMTDEEKTVLWNQMAQLFDNDISPYMEFKS